MWKATTSTDASATVSIGGLEWTYRLTWRQRLRYLWLAIRGKETIR